MSKLYSLTLKASAYATCLVEADNQEEAIKRFNDGQYEEFIVLDDEMEDYEWEVDEVEEA